MKQSKTHNRLSVGFCRQPLDNQAFLQVIADSEIPLKDQLLEMYSII
jgi:hypothetical protein